MAKLVLMPIAAVLVLLFAGVAQATCTAGYKDCDKDYKKNGCEVNINTDVNNCGDCGTKCIAPVNAIANCNGGKCEYSCKPGYFNCDGDWSNGCEATCGSDTNNCGACGNKCEDVANAVTKCNGGKCEYTCNPGAFNCDGDWKNGCEATCDSDTNNCGACGNKCEDVANAVTKCNGGKCDYTCKPGYFNCDGDWKNGCEGFCGSDVNNCGACGKKCEDAPYAVVKCNGGKCEYSCKPGYDNCDGDWSNGCERSCGSDPDNCGKCGKKCLEVPYAVTKCKGGKCEYFCKPGHANCDGMWWNGCECQPGTDPNNCGGCGKKCPSPKYAGGEAKCSYGKCETQSCKKGWNWENKKKCCVKKCVFFACW